MKKRICILGSTGSIGEQTLEVIKEHHEKFEVVALAAMRNIERLEQQIQIFKPKIVAVFDREKAKALENRILGKTKIRSGMEGLIEAATIQEADIVVNSVVGSVGLKPTIEAIRSKKNIALANKETLVVAGALVMQEVQKNNVKMIPIDSEHSAIFQCLQGEDIKDLSKIILTASGGPFKDLSKSQIEKVKSKDALKHPNWSMGKKITIDSSTLMNKGLEVIEAKWLFNMEMDKIEVVIHPQSMIHSMIELKDHSVIAQLGVPDMKLPIQYALSYPERFEGNTKGLDFKTIGSLTFFEPDLDRFPCLRLAYEAIKIGGTMPCVLNGANEILVQYFLEDKIGFYDIPKYIEKAMENHHPTVYNCIDELQEIDDWVRNWIENQLK